MKRCVDSIVSQTYKNLEIILIDDGSPDNSGKMCDELAKKDIRIQVIHKKNGGLSSARNAGIQVASGEFITFVDSDDWIDNEIYQKVMETFGKYKCDVVDYKTVFTDGNTIPKLHTSDGKSIIVKNDEILYDYLYRGQTEKCPFSVCRKVYKRNLFEKISFP
ncbi:MAG: glycosyltransferase family 2 protein, partial [Eubacteriales bacterium]|nr:glycosyltransferase family 2 protein [Eubacteriales bacterium]